MKLIVLYGPENSGKTTILKMVYEALKKVNLVEMNIFKYYDDDCGFKDFRDVLVLDKNGFSYLKGNYPNVLNNNYQQESLPNTGTNNVDVQKDQKSFSENEILELPENICEHFSILEKIKKEKASIESFKDGFALSSKNTHILQQPFVPLTSSPSLIGIITEGDYGFEHNSKLSSKHNRNLYKHLVQLRFCDIILCACTEMDASTPLLQQPETCIKYFLHLCNNVGIPISLLYYVNSCNFYKNERFPSKLIKERKVADGIISII